MDNDKIVLKTKRKRGEDGYKIFSVRIREDIVAEIDQIAFDSGHSRNELISTFIEFAIKRCEIEK